VDAKSRAVAAEAQTHRERADALRGKLDSLTLLADTLGPHYERQAALLVSEIEAADAEADALEARVQRRRTVSTRAVVAASSLPLEEQQAALRDLLTDVYVLPTPRMGRGQRALIPKRVELVWQPDIADVDERAAVLDGENVRVTLSVAAPEALRAVTERRRGTAPR